MKDADGKRINNHYFAAPVKIDEKTKIIFIRVRESAGDKSRFYIHDVFTSDEIEKVNSYSGTPVTLRAKTDADLYKSIILDYEKNNIIQNNPILFQSEAEKAVQMEKNAKLGIPEAERQRELVRKQYQDTEKWMKAPNGRSTNLTEEQWIAVRTPNFKRWFGNWEFDESKIVKTVELNNSSVEFDHNNASGVEKWLIKNLSGKSIIIDSSGAKVLFFNKGLQDSLKRHGEIQRNSYAVLEELILKSELFDFEKNDGLLKHNGILGQDIYYSVLKAGEKYYSVQFKFNVSGKYRTDSYKDHKITEIKTAPLLYHGSKNAHAITGAVHDFSINEITGGVNPVSSKVLDENGEPLVVYYGTDKEFDVFDSSKSRLNMDIQGNFFSPNELEAKDYGQNVKSFFLNIKNPANQAEGYKVFQNFKGQNEAGIKARNLLQQQGFDGVNNENEEFIVFNSNQVKSAVDNNGNFDINNDSVLF